MKKNLIIAFSIIIIVYTAIVLYTVNFGTCSEIYLNYGVKLHKPLNTEIVYTYDFGEGEDFYMLNYDKKKDIKKIINRNSFTKITEDNLEDITKVLEKYRNDLCKDELGKFDNTTSVSELALIGNYYLHSDENEIFNEHNEHYFVEIIFPKNKKLYHFGINH